MWGQRITWALVNSLLHSHYDQGAPHSHSPYAWMNLLVLEIDVDEEHEKAKHPTNLEKSNKFYNHWIVTIIVKTSKNVIWRVVVSKEKSNNFYNLCPMILIIFSCLVLIECHLQMHIEYSEVMEGDYGPTEANS